MDAETRTALDRAIGFVVDEDVREALREIVRRVEFRDLPFRFKKRDETSTIFVLAPAGEDFPSLEVFRRRLCYTDDHPISIHAPREIQGDMFGGALPGFPDPI